MENTRFEDKYYRKLHCELLKKSKYKLTNSIRFFIIHILINNYCIKSQNVEFLFQNLVNFADCHSFPILKITLFFPSVPIPASVPSECHEILELGNEKTDKLSAFFFSSLVCSQRFNVFLLVNNFVIFYNYAQTV